MGFNRGILENTWMLGSTCLAGVSSTSWGIVVSLATVARAFALTSKSISLGSSAADADTTGRAGSEG